MQGRIWKKSNTKNKDEYRRVKEEVQRKNNGIDGSTQIKYKEIEIK